jgi:hypothetical protein
VEPAKNIRPVRTAMMAKNVFGIIIPSVGRPLEKANLAMEVVRLHFLLLPFYNTLRGKKIRERRE